MTSGQTLELIRELRSRYDEYPWAEKPSHPDLGGRSVVQAIFDGDVAPALWALWSSQEGLRPEDFEPFDPDAPDVAEVVFLDPVARRQAALLESGVVDPREAEGEVRGLLGLNPAPRRVSFVADQDGRVPREALEELAGANRLDVDPPEKGSS